MTTMIPVLPPFDQSTLQRLRDADPIVQRYRARFALFDWSGMDMISQGPRCADVTFPEKTITWLHIIPVDASGNNGYSEVEVWATTGPQYSNNTCVNKIMVPQTIPQAVL